MGEQNTTNRFTYSNTKGLSVMYKKEKVDNIVNLVYKNQDKIFKELKENSVAKYCFIQEEILKGDIHKNLVFQFVYTSFYGMKVAGLTERFIEVYFSLMNKYYQEGNMNLDDIVKLLYQEKNRKGQESIQFSFSSKLLHTLDSACTETLTILIINNIMLIISLNLYCLILLKIVKMLKFKHLIV